MFFFKFLHSFMFCNCLCFFASLYNFLRTFSSLMLQHTSQNKKSSWTNFECEEVWSPFPPLIFFVWDSSLFFALNIHFFQAPHSFHDGLAPICPHGSSYYLSMVHMHFDLHHSSIYHRHHLPLHLSTSLPCAKICSNWIIELANLTIESSNLCEVLITCLSSLFYGCHGVASSSSFSSI